VQRHPSLDDRFDPAVRIVDHDPAWRTEAEAEIEQVRGALGDLAIRVDHIGSTAVPGLAAKPIIDLQASVSSVAPIETYADPLERLGYLFGPDPEFSDWHFFAKPPQRPRTHHLHVVAAGSDHERRHLAVRDHLRSHPDEAATYAALKRRVVAEHPDDRLAYIEGKAAYMAALEAQALSSFSSSS
jgi:GrpB-like predicted nucleotidyltransferase (UPF0157 family)